ncbi:MAG: hypothetical protein V8Q43_01605 [Christensenellaceae bacterium]
MKGASGVIANLAEDIQKNVPFSARELQEAVRRECTGCCLMCARSR